MKNKLKESEVKTMPELPVSKRPGYYQIATPKEMYFTDNIIVKKIFEDTEENKK